MRTIKYANRIERDYKRKSPENRADTQCRESILRSQWSSEDASLVVAIDKYLIEKQVHLFQHVALDNSVRPWDIPFPGGRNAT